MYSMKQVSYDVRACTESLFLLLISGNLPNPFLGPRFKTLSIVETCQFLPAYLIRCIVLLELETNTTIFKKKFTIETIEWLLVNIYVYMYNF